MKDPLGSLMPAGAMHWLAVGVAFVTALATYLTANAKRPPATVTPASAPEPVVTTTPDDKPSGGAPKPQIGTAAAGLALVAGGAVWATLRRARIHRSVVPLALVIRPSDFHAWVSAAVDRHHRTQFFDLKAGF